jgi:hypothetical protein
MKNPQDTQGRVTVNYDCVVMILRLPGIWATLKSYSFGFGVCFQCNYSNKR